MDQQEQYSRRNYLLIHEITEGNQENADALALKIFKGKLDIELTQRDLDQIHRIVKTIRAIMDLAQHCKLYSAE